MNTMTTPKFRRRAVAACAVLGLATAALVAAPGAAAEQPVVTVISVNTSFTNTIVCSFPVQQTAVGEIRVTTFADGTVVQHRDLTITLSANGVTIPSKHQATFFFDGVERTSVGLVGLADLPDGGQLVIDVGRLTIDLRTREVLFDAGQHDVLPSGQPTTLCPYLAG
jgi:hypothetical protein